MSIFHGKYLIPLGLTTMFAPGLAGCMNAVSAEQSVALPKDPLPVRAVQVATASLRPSVELVGALVPLPEKTSLVSPQVSGWVQKVSVVEGATVRAGDELVLLDTRLAEIEAAKKAAGVAEKEATFAKLKHGSGPEEIEIARQEVRKCEEAVASARAELEALKPLRQKNEIPALLYLKAESTLRSNIAGQVAAEAKLKSLADGASPEDIAEAEARLAMAKAELAGAKLRLEMCRITSPIAGTVTRLVVRQGMFVKQRSSPLVTIADLSRMFVQVRIPSLHVHKIRQLGSVEVRMPCRPDQVLSASVARFSGQADPATGDLEAFVEVCGGNGSVLCPGLACQTRILLPELIGALTVPAGALAHRSGTPFVTVIRDGKARTVAVAIGARTSKHVEITQGLSPGEWVITEGGHGLPEDCPVRIVAEARVTQAPVVR